MKYSKVLDPTTGVLQRIEKGGNIFSIAEQISRTEYYCLSVGLKLYVLHTKTSEDLTYEDWGVIE